MFICSWGAAYKGALSFRCSHYFICFLSHCTMLMAGLGATRSQKQSQMLGYSITKPWLIELPRSLVDVVVYWNLSMHYWLKTCNSLHFICDLIAWCQIYLFLFRCIHATETKRPVLCHYTYVHCVIAAPWLESTIGGCASFVRLRHLCGIRSAEESRWNIWCMRLGKCLHWLLASL